MATNDGGPAFPGTRTLHVTHTDGSEETGFVEMRGMTLRDYFAAHAPITVGDVLATMKSQNIEETVESMLRNMALMRVMYADAMLSVLAAREAGK